MNYTLIEIVNRSRQSQTKALWLGVSAFGLNMQFSEFKSGRIPWEKKINKKNAKQHKAREN